MVTRVLWSKLGGDVEKEKTLNCVSLKSQLAIKIWTYTACVYISIAAIGYVNYLLFSIFFMFYLFFRPCKITFSTPPAPQTPHPRVSGLCIAWICHLAHRGVPPHGAYRVHDSSRDWRIPAFQVKSHRNQEDLCQVSLILHEIFIFVY